MSRICFVIMPFSKTATCNGRQWTFIFNQVFKPTIEGSGLDYECRRSVATRGNIVKQIINELNDSWVVLADLTDNNPNVSYELGVRHSLQQRTILVAQRRAQIPFDLRSYANHVYDWKTARGRVRFAKQIRELLVEIDANPARVDNPVGDYLNVKPPPTCRFDGLPCWDTTVGAIIPTAPALAGPAASKLDIRTLVRQLAGKDRP